MTESITRLHISPLTPALLDSILAPSIRPLATDISFHNIATFPENDYGFVSLPAMEADKLKKKLNGSILKGRKFKVEAARADPKKTKTETKVDSDKTSENIASRKSTKTSSKRKAEESVLEGHELPGDRHVKRGWTEPASAKRLKKQKKTDAEASKTKLQTKSKYTEKAECLFKMKMPPNKMSEAVSKKTKSKKSKAPNEVVVHEFAQTVTHPSFLKSTIGGKPVTAKFEDGKGWVDEDGNVQEETSSKKTRTEDYHPGKKDGAKERAISKEKSRTKAVKAKKKSPSPDETSSSEEEDQEPDWTSSSGSSDSDSSTSDSDSDIESDDSSSSGASSLSDREGEITKNAQATIKSKAIEFDKGEAENDSISESDSAQESPEVDSGTKASESSQPPETTTQAKEVHPLEALFKRTPTEKSVPESPKPTFSFFADNDDDIEDENDDVAPVSLEPLTPFSKQDRQFRGLRSGAPTPDTAVFNRRKFLVPAEGDNADEDMDMDTDEDDDNTQTLGEESPSKARGETATQQLEESDFVKWFWENRGDNNRAWKRRRREAAKEKRQRENRRKGLKGRG